MSELNSARFAQAIELIDTVHAQDPKRVVVEGQEFPHELLYARRMCEELARLDPDAGEALRLAVRGQHLRRWQSPRDAYPMDRMGYLKWRTDLKNLHARELGEIMTSVGYDEETIARAKSLVKKERLKQDAEAQALEDCACLVFLRYEAGDFAVKHEREKVIDILRKTWPKMSARAQALAGSIDLDPAVKEFLVAALAPD